MTLVTDSLPNDLQALKTLVSAQRAEIERLKMMIAKLRRTQFGRSSEQLDAMIDQLQLSLEELQVSQTTRYCLSSSAVLHRGRQCLPTGRRGWRTWLATTR